MAQEVSLAACHEEVCISVAARDSDCRVAHHLLVQGHSVQQAPVVTAAMEASAAAAAAAQAASQDLEVTAGVD